MRTERGRYVARPCRWWKKLSRDMRRLYNLLKTSMLFIHWTESKHEKSHPAKIYRRQTHLWICIISILYSSKTIKNKELTLLIYNVTDLSRRSFAFLICLRYSLQWKCWKIYLKAMTNSTPHYKHKTSPLSYSYKHPLVTCTRQVCTTNLRSA